MKEITEIIQSFDEAQKQGRQTALATVVHVDGSSYRQPGARMLVTDEGKLTGAISGGCLEGDALRQALLVMAEQKTKLITYDTTDEDDVNFGVGLGCNGIIHILLEPIDPSKPDNPIQLFKSILNQRQKAVVVTLFSLKDRWGAQPGTCLLHSEQETIKRNTPGEKLYDILLADTKKAFDRKESATKTYVSENNQYTAFIELINPPVSLVIIGAGNDVKPLVQIAGVLGWETTLADGRTNYAKAERFPTAKKVILAKPDKVLSQLVVDDRTVFVLMTHNYNYDMAMLRQLVKEKINYIGILGPRKKTDRMLHELKEEGITLNDEQLSVIYGPVGFDIGAEASEEIALSIAAEIKAVLAGRGGQSLKNNMVNIHSRSLQTIEEVKL